MEDGGKWKGIKANSIREPPPQSRIATPPPAYTPRDLTRTDHHPHPRPHPSPFDRQNAEAGAGAGAGGGPFMVWDEGALCYRWGNGGEAAV